MRPTPLDYLKQLPKRLFRYRIAGAALLGLILAFGLISALWLPGVIKGKAERLLTDTLGRTVSIGEIRISPYRLQLEVKDLRIAQAGGPDHLLRVQGILANLSSTSLFYRAPVLQELVITGPDLKLARDAGGRLSVADIVARFAQAPASDKPLRFAVHNIQLRQGQIEFQDLVKNKIHLVSAITVGVPVVINFPAKEDIWVEPTLSANVNGAPFALKAKTHPFGPHKEATASLEVEDLPLAGLEAYVDLLPGVAVTQGKLSARLDVSFTQQADRPASTQLRGEIRVTELSASHRPSQGGLHASIENLNASLEGIQLITPAFLDQSQIQRLSISTGPKGRVMLRDASLDKVNPFVARDLAFSMDGIALSSAKPSEINLSTTINQAGKLHAKGTVGGWMDPIKNLNADLNVSARQVDVIAFQRLAGDFLNNALFTRGQASFDGKIQVAPARQKDGSAQALALQVQGSGALNDLSLLDQSSSAEIARWKALRLRGIELTTQPLKTRIQQIEADGLFGRLTILPSGELNFHQILEPPRVQTPATIEAKAMPSAPAGSQAIPVPAKPKTELPIEIDKIRLTDSSLIFNDQFTKPNFRASLNNLAGTLGPLKPGAPGAIDITGTVDRSAPLSVQGRVDPFGKELFLDIKAIARGIEMPPMSPYSIKYLAYPIEKGKLSLNLSYLVQNGQLKADNQIFLDQLTLGERVESPDAISAPVTLAIALLKNSRGEIDINLPISGSINDPEFKIGSIVFKALRNLIVKAATAPFTLVASLFGGGADVSQLTFAPGSAAINEAAAKSLDAIARAMLDRPALRLDITGAASAAADTRGAKRTVLQRQVRAEKLAEAAKKGESAASLRDIQVSPEEYPTYLAAVYKKASFKKERNLLLMTKILPVPEMEALLLEHIQVGEAELLALADQRSRAARNQLIQQGVQAERIFVLGSKLDPPTATAKTPPPGRAEFALR